MGGSLAGAVDPPVVIDAHVHFWDPAVLDYRWLEGLPELHRGFGAEDLTHAAAGVPLAGVIFVEANCAPEQAGAEVDRVARLAASDDRIVGMVGAAELTATGTLSALLDRYGTRQEVRGIRHNIQGHQPGFCLRPDFVEGVREAGRRGLSFDVCATHDQLGEVVELARTCPETRLVLDHCGKPDIAGRRLDPWRDHVRELGRMPHVWCKLSGLLTETGAVGWTEDDLVPYAEHVAEAFGRQRLMYGSDWPVVTLAGTYLGWYQFTRRFTGGWSPSERAAFYAGNARRFYEI
jgi:L-fuconolactonase